MSRIDKALRAYEDSVGRRRGEADEVSRTTRTTLRDYAAEGEGIREAAAAVPIAAPRPLSDRVAVSLPGHAVAPAPAPVPIHPSAPTTAAPAVVKSPPLPRESVAAPAVIRSRSSVDRETALRLVTSGSSAVLVEQYRRLAATLHDIQQGNGLKTVMITSAAPNEGKTLTCVNLAYTLSDSYARRVLVIDGDLRRPSLHSLLGASNTRGLAEVLNEEHGALPLVELSERLSLLTAGRPAAMPLAGLSSPRMRSVLAQGESLFDWILVDTPPVGVLPDAQLLARLTGGVVFVIGAGVTPSALVARAVAELGAECIIGTVLNRVDAHTISEAGYIDRYHSSPAEAES